MRLDQVHLIWDLSLIFPVLYSLFVGLNLCRDYTILDLVHPPLDRDVSLQIHMKVYYLSHSCNLGRSSQALANQTTTFADPCRKLSTLGQCLLVPRCKLRVQEVLHL